MIRIINNTIKLKENKKDFLDMNSIVNKQMDEVINKIKSKLNSLTSEHEAEVTLFGKIYEFNLIIKSESDETVSIIEKLIKDYLN